MAAMVDHSKDYPLLSIRFLIFQAIGYNVLVYLLTRFMRNRKPYNVRTLVKAHNISMSLFSGIWAVLSLWVSYLDGRFDSHDAFHCHPPRTPRYLFVMYVFYLSKLWEMIDTILLIVSKRPVIWLHQIHHTSTVSVVAVVFHGSVGHDVLPLVENLLVHFFMYGYYAFPWKLPFIRMCMTSMQMIQFMHVLSYSVVHWVEILSTGRVRCDESAWVLAYDTLWYLIYLVMFINFFMQQYVRKVGKDGKPMAAAQRAKAGKQE